MAEPIEGWGARVGTGGDVQAAIERAGIAYKARYGCPASHVALPPGTDASRLKLWTLNVAEKPAQPGTVIVGRTVSRRALSSD